MIVNKNDWEKFMRGAGCLTLDFIAVAPPSKPRGIAKCPMCHRHEAEDGGICEQCESIKMDVEMERREL